MSTMRNAPPKITFKILRWFCKEWYAESIEGDVWEIYSRQVNEGEKWPGTKAFLTVIRFFRWRYIKNLEDLIPTSPISMYKNYFKVSIRSMRKNLGQTLLNVMGLSIGLATCLLIVMHVNEQLKFDRQFSDHRNIYRVTLNERGRSTPALLVKQIGEDFPEVVTGTRIVGLFESIIEVNGKYVKQRGIMHADSTFFDVFQASFIHGDDQGALTGPYDAVLTESTAEKLFPGVNPMGRIIHSLDEKYIITGVVADPPKTTTVPYQLIISMPKESWATAGYWTGNNFYSYLKLREGADPAILEAKMPAFVEKYIWPEISESNPDFESFSEYVAAGNSHLFRLVPLADIHLHHPRLTLGSPGSFQNMLVFSILSLFILALALINYINMTTARSSLRAKEIGLRKVVGSVRSDLTIQFLFESFLITGFAFAMSLFLAVAFIPYFNAVSGNAYVFADLLNVRNGTFFLMIYLITGVLAGLYPAVYLARMRPLVALKGQRTQGGKERLRSYLVVLQFAISITMITGTLIIYRQIQLMANRNLGLVADQVLVVKDGIKVSDRYQILKNELLSNANILNVGMSNSYPSFSMSDWNYYSDDFSVKVSPYNLFVTEEIQDVWGLNLTQGRFFDPTLATDSMSVVVNKRLVEEMGWSSPIGMTIARDEQEVYRVIGVVEDFATGSARQKNGSVLLRYAPAERIGREFGGDYVMIRISGNVMEALDHVEATWEKFLPGYPMEATFMDESFERLYESERRFGNLFIGFAVIAILLACIGLFALASFTMDRRKKEIALRKVMGATVPEIFTMACKDFGFLLILGSAIALPVSYYFGQGWLENYAERIEIDFQLFIVPFAIVSVIAFLTIAHHTFQAAVRNPVGALKEE